MSVCRHVLRLASRSLPLLRREEWLAEWEGELWALHARGERKMALLQFAMDGWRESRWEKRREERAVSGFVHDVRQAMRRLGRSPGLVIVSILVLALGIGANTALFSALRAALLSAPPYPAADRLVMVDLIRLPSGDAAADTFPWSYPKYAHVRDALQAVEKLAAFAPRPGTLTGDGVAARIGVEYVTPTYFELLGVRAAVGRVFDESEALPGSSPVVLLEHGFWRTRFGGDFAVLGRTVTLDGTTMQVAGVLPEGFRGLSGAADLWIPVVGLAAMGSERRLMNPWSHWLRSFGRLRDGVTLERARQEATAAGTRLAEAYPMPGESQRYGITMVPLLGARVNRVARMAVTAASVAGMLLLLIACANVGGLLLARASARRADIAVRAALGASRARLRRELLLESLLLAGAGGLAGLVLALALQDVVAQGVGAALDTTGTRSLQFLAPDSFAVDGALLLVGLMLALATGWLFGMLPARAATRPDLTQDLRTGQRTMSDRRDVAEIGRNVLVAGQLALTLVLLTGAALMAASFAKLSNIDRGFRNDAVLTLRFDRGPAPSPDQSHAFEAQLLERIRELPDVQAAATGTCPPLSEPCEIVGLRAIDDRPDSPSEDMRRVLAYAVSDDYFRTLGIDLIEGRTFQPGDGGPRPIAIINETAARQFFPGRSPIGGRMRVTHDLTAEQGAEIVGVTADVPYDQLEEPILPAIYFLRRQAPSSYGTLFVHARGEPLALITSVREIVAQLDPELPLYDVSTLGDRHAVATARTRIVTGLLTSFAAGGLTLAAIGLYGLVAYGVVRRTREMGLRLALGARPTSLLSLAVRPAVRLALAGTAAGTLAGVLLTRFIQALLYGIEPSDPRVLLAAALFLVATALSAAVIPAVRAMRVDPARALRSD